MVKHLSVLAVLLVAAAWAQQASGLTADDVAVIANADVPESLAVAQFYAQQRGIDPSRLIALKMTGGYVISRQEYESQLCQPLRAAMMQRGLAGKVRCLVTVWGVPVRVSGPPNPVGDVMATEATKAHYRLATDYELLGTVGRKFPEPRTEGLTPLAELFDSTATTVEPLPAWDALVKDVDALLAMKLADFRRIKDPSQQRIAWRQLMGLHLDIHGLEGLVKFVREAGLTDAPALDQLRLHLGQAREKLQELEAQPITTENAHALLEAMRKVGGVVAAGSYAMQHKPSSSVLEATDAAVDSELAILWWPDAPLGKQLPNPLFWRRQASEHGSGQALPPVMMTSRIDGPTPRDAMRIVAESLAAERTGLAGNFYIDAGGPERAKQYDATFRALQRFLRANTRLKVVMDEGQAVFQPGTCPQSALYVGWYSLQKYVPAFQWVPGAVGWHVASFEAMHLRDPSSEEWCPKMIQGGVAATIGAVDEPVLASFPRPDEFYPLLLTGRYTVAECYWRTTPVVSWRVLLIADPLYNPFKADPQVATDKLQPGLAPPPDWGSAQAWQPATQATSQPR